MYTRTIGKQTIPIQNATLSHKGSLNTKHSPAQGQWYQERVRVSVSVIVYSVCILSDFSLDWSKVNSNLQWIPPCVLVDLKQRCQVLVTLKKLSKVFWQKATFSLIFFWSKRNLKDSTDFKIMISTRCLGMWFRAQHVQKILNCLWSRCTQSWEVQEENLAWFAKRSVRCR